MLVTEAMKRMIISVIRRGERILPSIFDSRSGCSATSDAARKKTTEYMSMNSLLSGRIISALVLAVLGMARHGPIAR